MITLFTQASLIILTFVTLLWIWSILIKNVSIVDIFWGFGFVVVNAFYVFMSGELNNRKILILTLVSIWGLRLAFYLAYRNIGKKEDFRYQEFRRNYGPKRYWWFSFFQTFLLQGALIMIVSLPLLGINSSKSNGTFEAVGDFQLTRFKSNFKNKGKVLNTGFWKYTRHPNYFGDSAVWWAYGIFSIAAGSYWQIVGSIVMTFLILKISGVSLLEKTLKETKPHYRDYIQKTNSFFPWLPKK